MTGSTALVTSTSWGVDTHSTVGSQPSAEVNRAKAFANLAAVSRNPAGSTAKRDDAGEVGTAAVAVPAGRREPTVLVAEWNGCVTSVDTDFFSAELTGITGEGVRGEQEDAEIPLSDVSDADRELLHPGNFFRLCVFYESRDGQPLRYTKVVFRRLPAYRSVDLQRAAERAAEIHRHLRVE